MFFSASRENLTGTLPKAVGALSKAAGALSKAAGALSKEAGALPKAVGALSFAPCDTASPRLPSQQAWRHWACSVQQLGLWERREQRACFSSCARWTG